MTRGLEVLDDIKNKLRELEFVCVHNHRERAPYIDETKWNIIEKELKELEQIKMILEDFKLTNLQNLIDFLRNTIYENKKFDRLVKEHKALEIIKEKNVFVWSFVHMKEELKNLGYIYYKSHCGLFHSGYNVSSCFLTQEEYDLLKEVLL